MGKFIDLTGQKFGRLTVIQRYFDTKRNAIKARLQAEKDYFGEFAPQIHLFKEYDII